MKNSVFSEFRQFLRNKELFILSAPGLLYIFIFGYLPLVGLIIAFKKYRFDLGMFGSEWVGFSNFEFFFVSDYAYLITRNTVLYNVAFIIVGTLTALIFAMLLNEISRKWVKLHQTTLFLPYFLSWIVISYVVAAFLDFEHGYFNQLLETLGGERIRFYFEEVYWPYFLILINLWKGVGFATLVYYAGIMGIDSDYYEAAKIDGANKIQMAYRITFPLLLPLIMILFIISVGGMFRADFGLFFFVPKNSGFLFDATDVIDTYVYRALMEIGDLGMSTAVGFYQSVVGLILVLLANYVIRKVNSENSLW